MVALRGENRGVSPLISTLFMILVTVVVGMTLVVGALTFLPDSTATRPQADFVIEDHTVEVNTACGLSGVASRFAYAQVNARRVPLSDQEYAFTLSIDPDGPNSVGGARTYPTTNPWNYVERHDQTVSGLEPPVYVVVFADGYGMDWDSTPTDSEREQIANSFCRRRPRD